MLSRPRALPRSALLAVVLLAHALALWALARGLRPQPVAAPAALIRVVAETPRSDAQPSTAQPRPNRIASPQAQRPRPLLRRTADPAPRSAPAEQRLPVPAAPTPPAPAAPPLPPAPQPAPRPAGPAQRTASPVTAAPALAPPTPPAPAEPDVPPSAAAYLDNPPPAYPSVARRLGQEGTVVLRVAVSADGHTESVAVQRSSGWPDLDQAALRAVGNWRFRPARRAGLAVPGTVLVPVRFALDAPDS